MNEKIYGVLEEAILTAPLLLSLGEFDTDVVDFVTEQRKIAKHKPKDLISTLKFVFEHGYIEYEYLFAILKNDSLNQEVLFHFLLLFISIDRSSLEEEDLTVIKIGSRHPNYDSAKFECFLIEHISDCSIQVAKNTLASRSVLKKLVLRKGADCIALEAAISNPNMDFEVLDQIFWQSRFTWRIVIQPSIVYKNRWKMDLKITMKSLGLTRQQFN